MWCNRCHKQVSDCTCPDIEERLKGLGKIAEIAVEQNLEARRRKRDQNEVSD